MKIKITLFSIIFLLAASRSFSAPGDTTVIVNSAPGILEATINGDVTNNVRNNPNRVYVLQKNQIYVQHAPIAIINPTGTLTIVGESGGRKPIIVMDPVNGPIGQNTVQGSIKMVNIHYQGMQMDKTQNNENWFMTTGSAVSGGPKLPQSLTIDSCLFEFTNIDFFECNGWTNGAKFFIKNSYFRNMFHPQQWWGSRVYMCKNPVDTLWVENVTTTGGGLTFLMQNSLTIFAYLNHNTIVNNKKNWLQSQFYIKFIVTNNIFINHNWAGEDTNIVNQEDTDRKYHTSTINIDTTNSPGSTIMVQPQFRTANGGYTADVGLDRMKVFVSNNVNYNDTLMNRYYLNENNAYNAVGPYPVSYLNYKGWGNGPWVVHNVPGEWMNTRTKALFAAYPQGMIEDNTITANPQTVTPGIKDATVANQMALWDESQWGVPNTPANTITQSAYIFGDYDPTTIPGIVNGVKTENAGSNAGITKFTDLIENFSQSTYISTIDYLPIGSLIWNDSLFAQYNPADDFQKVIARYSALGGSITEVKESPAVAYDFKLSQNYPNPFNPSTTIAFTLPSRSFVTLKIFDILGREMATIVSEELAAGNYTRQWNAANLSSGVYFYRLQTGSSAQTKKLILLK
ncbi:MAG: T9SS type A sorting domain-containing protein [Bacteroidota bacterium]